MRPKSRKTRAEFTVSKYHKMVQNIVLCKIVSKIVENIVSATIEKIFIAKYATCQ